MLRQALQVVDQIPHDLGPPNAALGVAHDLDPPAAASGVPAGQNHVVSASAPQSLAQKGAVQRGWRVLISRPHTSKDRKEKTVSVAVRDATRADTILLRVGEKPHLPKGLGAGPWGVEQERGRVAMRAMTHKMTLLLKWKMTRPSRFFEMKQMYY